MGGLVVIGERALVEGYALAGARVCVADDAAGVRAAWQALPAGTALVIVTPAAAAAFPAPSTADRLVVVLP